MSNTFPAGVDDVVWGSYPENPPAKAKEPRKRV